MMGPLSWLSHAPLLARMPLTPSIGASLGGVAVIATTAAAGIAGPHEHRAGRGPRAAPAPRRSSRRDAARAAAATDAQRRRRQRRPADAVACRGRRPEAARPESAARHGAGAGRRTRRPLSRSRAASPAPDPPRRAAGIRPRPPPDHAGPHRPPPAPAAAAPPTPPVLPSPVVPPPPAPRRPERRAELHRGTRTRPRSRTPALSRSRDWATAISPGPASESSQTVSFTVDADNPALFTVQPAIAADGTLTYKPAADANGVATVTVTAVDNGGTANGGTNTSAPGPSPSRSPPSTTPRASAPERTRPCSRMAALRSVAGWATAISPGPADESSQSVTFTAGADHPALFSRPAGRCRRRNADLHAGRERERRRDRSPSPPSTTAAPPTAAPTPAPAGRSRSRSPPSTTPRASPRARTGRIARTTARNRRLAPRPRSRPDPQTSHRRASPSMSPATTRHSSPSNQPSQPTEHSRTPSPRTPTASRRSPSPPSTMAAPPTAARTPASPADLTITVEPVNDAPAFSAGSDQSAVSLLGTQTIPGWATGITPARPTSRPRTSPSSSRAPTEGFSPSNPQ